MTTWGTGNIYLGLTLGDSLFSFNFDNYIMTSIRIMGITNGSLKFRKVRQLIQGYTALNNSEETYFQV